MNRKVKPYHNLSTATSSHSMTGVVIAQSPSATSFMEQDAKGILPPTPAGLLNVISASPNPDPRHLMDLWEDFDRFIPNTPVVDIPTNMDIDGMLLTEDGTTEVSTHLYVGSIYILEWHFSSLFLFHITASPNRVERGDEVKVMMLI